MTKIKYFNINKSLTLIFGISCMLILSLTICTTNTYATQLNNKKPLSNQISSDHSITISEVIQAQNAWAKGIVTIGNAYLDHKDYQQVAKNLIQQLYAYNYENGIVLFKPTKASETPFRKTKESALSYFVGDNVNYSEDKGFAIQPWTKVVFHNDEMYFHGDMAIAMGTYDFTDTKGKVTSVEYTFAYVKNPKGQLKIVLHHSSIPYSS
ncbi:MAG: phosphoribosyl-AMP cyclohydrolase [Gammaproteobacteria bacterium]|nr:MAG: phosphoribosyl-AMP cyclohydrolase [Gammaproteobacteria bacterium]UTW42339.1 phosphoribosyl-AMP cyclohydrolase [bacterium SCSIO 12844]